MGWWYRSHRQRYGNPSDDGGHAPVKKVYPNPKRTLLVGHWEAEEQGLNGSRAFVADHPEILPKIQAVFNQDNGTGRVVKITGSGFVDAYDYYLSEWLAAVPGTIREEIDTEFPNAQSWWNRSCLLSCCWCSCI